MATAENAFLFFVFPPFRALFSSVGGGHFFFKILGKKDGSYRSKSKNKGKGMEDAIRYVLR